MKKKLLALLIVFVGLTGCSNQQSKVETGINIVTSNEGEVILKVEVDDTRDEAVELGLNLQEELVEKDNIIIESLKCLGSGEINSNMEAAFFIERYLTLQEKSIDDYDSSEQLEAEIRQLNIEYGGPIEKLYLLKGGIRDYITLFEIDVMHFETNQVNELDIFESDYELVDHGKIISLKTELPVEVLTGDASFWYNDDISIMSTTKNILFLNDEVLTMFKTINIATDYEDLKDSIVLKDEIERVKEEFAAFGDQFIIYECHFAAGQPLQGEIMINPYMLDSNMESFLIIVAQNGDQVKIALNAEEGKLQTMTFSNFNATKRELDELDILVGKISKEYFDVTGINIDEISYELSSSLKKEIVLKDYEGFNYGYDEVIYVIEDNLESIVGEDDYQLVLESLYNSGKHMTFDTRDFEIDELTAKLFSDPTFEVSISDPNHLMSHLLIDPQSYYFTIVEMDDEKQFTVVPVLKETEDEWRTRTRADVYNSIKGEWHKSNEDQLDRVYYIDDEYMFEYEGSEKYFSLDVHVIKNRFNSEDSMAILMNEIAFGEEDYLKFEEFFQENNITEIYAYEVANVLSEFGEERYEDTIHGSSNYVVFIPMKGELLTFREFQQYAFEAREKLDLHVKLGDPSNIKRNNELFYDRTQIRNINDFETFIVNELELIGIIEAE